MSLKHMPGYVIKSHSQAHHFHSGIKTPEITFVFHALLCIQRGFHVDTQDSAAPPAAAADETLCRLCSNYVLIADFHLNVLQREVKMTMEF